MSLADPALVSDEPLYEVIDGRRVELPPTGAREVFIASILVEYLAPFARAQQLGRVVAEMLFTLHPDNPRRRPDVAFISYQRWSRDRPIPSENAWEVVPDLAIEVVSLTDFAVDALAKVREYFQAGVRRVWVVYPTERLVYVYASPTSLRVLGPAEALDGEDLLPGLRLPVAALFEDAAGAGG